MEIEDYRDEKLIVIFDAARENFRNKIYPNYKKNNKKLIELENSFSWKSDLTHDEIDKIHYLEKVNFLRILWKKMVLYIEI